jgi:CBS domain-containing protein
MDQKIARIAPSTNMQLAAELLVLTQASDLAVVDAEGRFIGVLSEGDLLRAVMPDFEELVARGGSLREAFEVFLKAGRHIADQPIERLVIRESIVVAPSDDLLKAATVMASMQIRRLPVVEDQKLVGSVARADICWALLCKDVGRR